MITDIPIITPVFNFLSYYGLTVLFAGCPLILLYGYVVRPWLQKRHRAAVASRYGGINFEVARTERRR